MGERIVAFPPICRPMRIRLFWTMPGVRSLQANQYYAHPQNQFWRFMGDIYGAGPELPYAERVQI